MRVHRYTPSTDISVFWTANAPSMKTRQAPRPMTQRLAPPVHVDRQLVGCLPSARPHPYTPQHPNSSCRPAQFKLTVEIPTSIREGTDTFTKEPLVTRPPQGQNVLGMKPVLITVEKNSSTNLGRLKSCGVLKYL